MLLCKPSDGGFQKTVFVVVSEFCMKNLSSGTKTEWKKCPISHFLDWLVKVLQIRRGCVIKIGNNLRAFSPQKYPRMTIY